MATNRLVSDVTFASAETKKDDNNTVSVYLYDFVCPTATTFYFRYLSTHKNVLLIDGGDNTFLSYNINDETPNTIISESDNPRGVTTLQEFTSVSIFIRNQIFFSAPVSEDIIASLTYRFSIKDHPGSTILFVNTPNTYLRLPITNVSTGNLFIIKNNSGQILSIGPHKLESLVRIEYLADGHTSYTLAGTSVLKLLDNQCVGIISDGARWHVVMFYTGTGNASQGRDGGTTTEITSFTSDIVYGLIDDRHLRIKLPSPASREKLIIIAEKPTSSAGWQLQLDAPDGSLIDGRWSSLNLNITNNRRGNCAYFLISNGSAWAIAAMFDMSSMDNFSSGAITSAGTINSNSAVGVISTSTLSSDVWSGRSYNIVSVEPTSLTLGQAVFRIFKQYNNAGNGFGLTTTSPATFPDSYTGGTSRQQIFKYDATGLLSLFCVEMVSASGSRFLFLNQYPTNF